MTDWFTDCLPPFNQVVRVRAGGMKFLARYVPGGSLDLDGNACNQWQAVEDDKHPPCWSDGACWASNVDEEPSAQPTHWQPVDPQPHTGDQTSGRIG